MLELISKKSFLQYIKIFFSANPFPHIFIDNFFPQDEFIKVVNSLKKIYQWQA